MDFSIEILGRAIELRTKRLQLSGLSPGGNGWFPWGIIRESFTGAWQRNVELRADQVITNPTLFACVTLIAADVAKLCLRLVQEDEDDVWTPIDSPAFSPVLRRPNRFQHITEFIEQWMVSKLTQGNTYVLLQRDNRQVVRQMFVLDPSRVTPLVAPDGSVYYELKRDDLSEQKPETVVVPASEIIHDRMVCLFHPLIGVTPIYACGAAALQGLTIQGRSTNFFGNGAQPGGVLIAPKGITPEQAAALKLQWQTEFSGDNSGKVAVLGGELSYTQLGQNAVDSQLIDQLHWGDEKICSPYHVPPYMVGVGDPPPYANVEPLLQAYFSQCIQSHVNKLEKCLDHGLGLDEKIEGKQYGTEFDIGDLIWMDTTARIAAATNAVKGSVLSIDESRKQYLGRGRITGGDTIWMQQQNYSLEALAKRDDGDPFAKPATPAVPIPTADAPPADMAAKFAVALRRKALEAGLAA